LHSSPAQRAGSAGKNSGSYILKPSPQAYPAAALNEALTMRLAKEAGIDDPYHFGAESK